jgi:ribosome biogenesis SPOUT family RNA methylase Rps3
MIFIIEHLDPKVWKWSLLEYKHISSIVGKENLWFTNVSSGNNQLKKLGKVFAQSATTMKLQRACILESAGEQTLKPIDREKFEYFIFGGILGDYPEVNKSHVITKQLPKATVRNLGKDQMSTDTAVLVTKTILDGTPLERIPLKKGIEIKVNDTECIDLPYSYVLENNKPILPPGLVEMLKSQKTF